VTYEPVNLARRPFANTRPVVRVSILVWVVGGLLAVANGWLYSRSLFGLEDQRERVRELGERIAAERQQAAIAEDTLRGMDLREQNELAGFLNDRIAERTFPWSRLFGDLADVLPREVRLSSLAPQGFANEGRTRRRRTSRAPDPADRVHLQMSGTAQSDAALLELVQNLFDDRRFESPVLPVESRQTDGTIGFQVTVFYLPAVSAAGLPAESGEPLLAAGAGGASQGAAGQPAGPQAAPWGSDAAAGPQDVAAGAASGQGTTGERPPAGAAGVDASRAEAPPAASGATPRPWRERSGPVAPPSRAEVAPARPGVTPGRRDTTPPRPTPSRPADPPRPVPVTPSASRPGVPQ
jgi:hypothetical protein